jgi:hypothetical protein
MLTISRVFSSIGREAVPQEEEKGISVRQAKPGKGGSEK